MKEKNLDYGEITGKTKPKVYVIQEIPGTSEGRPKINIMGAREFGEFKFLLPELSQIIFPNPAPQGNFFPSSSVVTNKKPQLRSSKK